MVNGGTGTTTITNVDILDTVGGIAITAADGDGVWSFSLDQGSVFADVGIPTSANTDPWSSEKDQTPSPSAAVIAMPPTVSRMSTLVMVVVPGPPLTIPRRGSTSGVSSSDRRDGWAGVNSGGSLIGNRSSVTVASFRFPA